MKSQLFAILCGYLLLVFQSAHANPLGTSYFVSLTDDGDGGSNIDGSVVFDEAIEDIGWNAYGLVAVTEQVIPISPTSELINISIQAPTFGTPLFDANTFDNLDFNIGGLYWTEGPAASISVIEFYYTDLFGNPSPLNPGVVALSGAGTASDPIQAQATIPSTDFAFPLVGSLHISLEVTHVPIPAAVWLFGSGLLGLTGIARRKKASQ